MSAGLIIDFDNIFTDKLKSTNKKRDKGKSLLELPNEYIVIDLETTGLDPKFDSIIELSAIKVNNSKILDYFSTLVNPEFEIDYFITNLTGITNDMLKAAPILEDVFPKFLNFLGNSILLAHNANFDINFIYDNCKNPFKNNFIDTLRICRCVFKNQFENYKLETLANALNLEHKPSHRGLDDCYCAYELFEYTKKYINKNNLDINKIFSTNYTVKSSSITPENDNFNANNPLYNKTCVITGALEKFVRKDAMQIIANLGGINADSVTKKTDFLILGNNDLCKLIKDGKSSKQKKAEELILKGKDIKIISENVFYDIINDFLNENDI